MCLWKFVQRYDFFLLFQNNFKKKVCVFCPFARFCAFFAGKAMHMPVFTVKNRLRLQYWISVMPTHVVAVSPAVSGTCQP